MKYPKEIRTYCPYCNSHMVHKVEKVKRGRASSMKWSARQEKRRSKVGNRGKFSKVPGGAKPTKKINIRYRCKECGGAHTRKSFRVSRFELV